MDTFYFEFIGREVNAIGITYPCNRAVHAKTYDEAALKLYDTHEHIQVTHWTQWRDGKQIDGKNYRKVTTP